MFQEPQLFNSHIEMGPAPASLTVSGGPAEYTASFTPNDTYFRDQWNFSAMGMPTAWDYNRGGSSQVRVAVVDSGLYPVSDFRQDLIDWKNSWDFVYNDPYPYDYNGHGTHVAGTIAQATDNSRGVAGIAYNSTLLPLRVLDSLGGGSNANVVAAIDYAVAHRVDVINLSLGSSTYFPSLEAAINRAYQAGVLVVAAAGNQGKAGLAFPAAFSTVLAVGAVGRSGELPSFSNHARDMVLAPGVDIWQQSDWGWYVAASGTSMATPHVSALAALVIAEAQEEGAAMPAKGPARVDWIKNIIINSCQDLGAPGQDSTYGWGMARADWALASLQPAAAPAETPAEETKAPAQPRRGYDPGDGSFSPAGLSPALDATLAHLLAGAPLPAGTGAAWLAAPGQGGASLAQGLAGFHTGEAPLAAA